MTKLEKISEILNCRPTNNLFIDVNTKNIEAYIFILNQLYHKELLDKFLDDYFKYRKSANNYMKEIEFLKSLGRYALVFEGEKYENTYPKLDTDDLKTEFSRLKNELKKSIEKYRMREH